MIISSSVRMSSNSILCKESGCVSSVSMAIVVSSSHWCEKEAWLYKDNHARRRADGHRLPYPMARVLCHRSGATKISPTGFLIKESAPSVSQIVRGHTREIRNELMRVLADIVEYQINN